jgi:tetratricopeptide (TPR) repeat protein
LRSADEYVRLAKTKFDAGDLRGALTELNEAIEIDPTSATNHYLRGLVKLHLADLPGALVDLDKAIELKPDLAEAHINRGIVKQRQGDPDGAIAITIKRLNFNATTRWPTSIEPGREASKATPMERSRTLTGASTSTQKALIFISNVVS